MCENEEVWIAERHDDLDTVEIIAHSAKRSDVHFVPRRVDCMLPPSIFPLTLATIAPRLSFATSENVSRYRPGSP